jgi:Calcium binding
MPKTRKNHGREERIENEIVVDAYGPEERAMGWYYYLEDKIHFPFQAK